MKEVVKMFMYIILIVIGFVLLIKGADFLVDGASGIAKRFNIPEIVIGLTIVSIGTSMPELVVSVTSALEGHSDIAIGNVVGSNLANLLLILGVCSVIKPLEFKKETRIFEIPFMIFSTILLFFLSINGTSAELNKITRIEGIILLAFCLIFIIYNFIMAKKGVNFDEDTFVEIHTCENKEISIFQSLFGIVVGIIGLKLGGDLVVDNSVQIARLLEISEKLISLTIVAFSTSLPELITSIAATRKGDTDMAIGNIIGSQIFNILLIIGMSATLMPINYSTSYNSNIMLLIVSSIVLGIFPFVGKKNQMSRGNGALFVFTYFLYLGIIVAFSS